MAKAQAEKVQIREIAERLGLSQSTVSVVLNGRGDSLRIAKETQKRVLETAKEMNYQPNIYARRLRHAATEQTPYVIALFWRQDNLNSRLGRFIQGLHNAIEKRGCKVELVVQPYRAGSFVEYMDMLSSNRFSGAMISGLLEEEQEALEERDFSIPIILIGRDSVKFHCVLMDNYRAGEQCAASMDMRDVKAAAFMGFLCAGRAERMMEAGFMFGCRQRQVQVREDWNLRLEMSGHETGYRAAQTLLQKTALPAAWMVADCRLSGGIMDFCQERQIRVPQDLRLLFFEDSQILKYHKPSLSSVDVPSREMAENALDIMLLSCDNRIDIPIRRELLPVYHIRASSGEV